jgi:TPR repeat protein
MPSHLTIIQTAQQGDCEAQYQLGVLYELGLSVEKDLKLSFEYYQQSAQQNHAKAQYNLGIFYALGKGIEKDIPQAKHWIKQAHQNGYSGASIF